MKSQVGRVFSDSCGSDGHASSKREHRDEDLYWSSYLFACGFVAPSVGFWTAATTFSGIYFTAEETQWLLILFFAAALCTGLVSSFIPAQDRGHARATVGFGIFLVVGLAFPWTDMLLPDVNRSELTMVWVDMLVIAVGAAHALTLGCLTSIAMSLPSHYHLGMHHGIGTSFLFVSTLSASAEACLSGSDEARIRFSGHLLVLEAALISLACLTGHSIVYPPQIEHQGWHEADEEMALLDIDDTEEEPLYTRVVQSRWMQAAKSVRLEILNSFLVGLVSLAVYTGLYIAISDTEFSQWKRVVCMSFFGLGEWSGRRTPGVFLTNRAGAVSACVAARALLIPIVVASLWLSMWNGAFAYIAVVLGLSQGYTLVCTFDRAHAKLENLRSSFQGGTLLILALNAGLAVGAAAAFVWTTV